MEEVCKENGNLDGELLRLIQSVITTYVPVYLGNQLLYWSGQYWEESHPIISERMKSRDLVNEDLQLGLGRIAVCTPCGMG